MEPETCPVCGTSDITYGCLEMGMNEVTQDANCDDCGSQWTDIYTFNRVDITKGPEA